MALQNPYRKNNLVTPPRIGAPSIPLHKNLPKNKLNDKMRHIMHNKVYNKSSSCVVESVPKKNVLKIEIVDQNRPVRYR
jgi:hypothetical protein